ncbi:MAG: hypothetical protein SFY69_11055 [Planctomycetota bacterium]|nr:hypothetical protein [Planctomycetota bacterium]
MMGGARDMSLVELDGGRLTAVGVRLSTNQVDVRVWHAADRPAHVKADSAQEVGQWVRDELRKAEVPLGRVVLVIPRNDVVLKPLMFPAPADGPLRESDLGGMVRLQMSRQLTVTTEDTPIDFVPLRSAGTGVEVLAGALPAERRAWWDQMAGAAGMGVRRIALRCLGVGAILGDLSDRRDGTILGVAVGAHATDLVLVERGGVAMARAIDLARPDGEGGFEAFAERISVEARRTLGSFRAGRASSGVEGVFVMGEGELCHRVARLCGAALDSPGQSVGPGVLVRVPSAMPEAMRSDCAALLGLALETVQGRVSLDFANPRRAPDTRARLRQAALGGVLGLIVLCGAGYVWADRELGSMRSTLGVLRTREAGLRRESEKLARESARVAHAERWKDARADWLSHIAHVTGTMPEPGPAVLDDLSARAKGDGVYALEEKKSFPSGKWSSRVDVTIDLDGTISGRQVGADLRETLLSRGGYTVETPTADVPERFRLVLRTRSATAPATGGKDGAP